MQEIILKWYRQNVLAVIFNAKWQVFVWQNKWWWQDRTFVKWWIEKWESKKNALYREIFEETWLRESSLEIIYEYKNAFKKDFSQEEIQWKIKNKNEYFKWKEDHIFVVSYNGLWTIDLGTTDELIDYKWVDIDEIWSYIKNKKLLSLLDLCFLKKLIKREILKKMKYK